ncbi:MAG: filamentous hemagglutinin [Alkalinema sp. CACIAM 70d]|nr:MAG: filamentous hemagglutinin [Alkalinema sp. CACIAM 70d]
MKIQSIAGVLASLVVGIEGAVAQVVPDGTLSTSVTNSNNLNFTIDGGGRSGGNLFHSFNQFSVPTGGSAFFNNALDVQNIFARVTGGTASNIDGLLKANGSANLFLLNPSGILFGPNAALNIGGSFLGTTASSIRFADGTELSAVNSGTPLLTMSAPIGLQMGNNPGTITVQNTGHQLNFPINPFVSSPDRSNNPPGLSVNAGSTLALVGGDIILEGGVLNAPSGHLELGSASSGIVNLNTATSRWNFDYGALQQFGNIQLLQQSLADASGSPAGSIHFQGQNIHLVDGSAALLVNQGSGNSGDIRVNASGLLELRGIGTAGFPQSLLRSDNFGSGSGGNIIVSAANLLLQAGGSLHGFNFGAGPGGNISVAIQDLIQVEGLSPLSGFASSLNTQTAGAGKSGDLTVVTKGLRVLGGAVLGNSTSGQGAGGNTTVQASEFIEIAGEDPQSLADSVIVVGTFSQANAGQLTINTPKLIVRDGGGIVDSTVNSGNGGNLLINVSESIEVSGVGAISGLPSRIGARAELLAPPIRQLFGLPDVITGNIGMLTLNTPALHITDGAIVGVDHQGIGNAGDLHIQAGVISLDQAGQIIATTNSGQGGNINLNVNQLLTLRHGSDITATAGGMGNGGNILINSPIILGLENSNIIANAVNGNGGNIQITTQGILGLKFRNQLTPENDITASSQFGVNGSVQVNTIGTDPNSGLTDLPVNVADPSQQIATGCSANQGSQFIATGRGGLPPNPNQEMMRNLPWNDIRDLSAYRGHQSTVVEKPTTQPTLVQASNWKRNADGTIDLISSPTAVPSVSIATCSGAAPQTLLTKS